MAATFFFFEFFAGEGDLTHAAITEGIPSIQDEVRMGGTDFANAVHVENAKAKLSAAKAGCMKLLLHFAPPCATFSRARDRSWRTRLRSMERPQGLRGRGAQCRKANQIATCTKDFIEWAVVDLRAAVSLETPACSYLWSLLQFDSTLIYSDFVFSPCRFGGDFRKPTRLRCWGWAPSSLDAP